MKKKSHFISAFFSIAILLHIGVLDQENALNAKESAKAPSKSRKIISCKDSRGVVVAYGASCIAGEKDCIANDCPQGSGSSNE